MTRSHTIAWVLAASWGLTLVTMPRSAWASGAKEMHRALKAIEPLVPDLRLEFAEKPALNLSFPIHLDLNQVIRALPRRDRLWATSFIEPQYVPAFGEVRGLIGTRLMLPFDRDGLAVFVEGAAVLATDGNGGVAGGGLMFMENGVFDTSYLGIVYRHVFVTEGRRFDISLDLVAIPF